MSLVRVRDKTFPPSAQVTQRKVSFANRYGITRVADLYQPRDAAAQALPPSWWLAPSVRSRSSRLACMHRA